MEKNCKVQYCMYNCFNCLYKIGLWYHLKLQHLFFLINIYSVSVARNANLFAFCFLFNLTAIWVTIKGTHSDNEGYFNQQLSGILIGVGEVQFWEFLPLWDPERSIPVCAWWWEHPQKACFSKSFTFEEFVVIIGLNAVNLLYFVLQLP